MPEIDFLCNMKRHPYYLLLLLLLLPGYSPAQSPAVNLKAPLPYILDMVHDNPGEAPTLTKYTDPSYLKKCGFTGMVPQWYVQCGVMYDSFEN